METINFAVEERVRKVQDEAIVRRSAVIIILRFTGLLMLELTQDL